MQAQIIESLLFHNHSAHCDVKIQQAFYINFTHRFNERMHLNCAYNRG